MAGQEDTKLTVAIQNVEADPAVKTALWAGEAVNRKLREDERSATAGSNAALLDTIAFDYLLKKTGVAVVKAMQKQGIDGNEAAFEQIRSDMNGQFQHDMNMTTPPVMSAEEKNNVGKLTSDALKVAAILTDPDSKELLRDLEAINRGIFNKELNPFRDEKSYTEAMDNDQRGKSSPPGSPNVLDTRIYAQGQDEVNKLTDKVVARYSGSDMTALEVLDILNGQMKKDLRNRSSMDIGDMRILMGFQADDFIQFMEYAEGHQEDKGANTPSAKPNGSQVKPSQKR